MKTKAKTRDRKAVSRATRARKKTKKKRTSPSRPGGAFQVSAYLEAKRKLVDAALEEALPRKDYFPAKLHSAIRHSVFSGGKRLRPVLLLAAAEACGGKKSNIMPAACALECIHTYSLLHDDLPAMDDDAWRRGQPTCHKVFGEAAAILAGDALLTFAFELMSKCAAPAKGTPAAAAVLDAIRVLAQSAGMAGMVGGQMADVDAEGQDVNIPMLQYIHTHKTGRIIQGALRIGGILAGATSEQLKALSLYGEAAGLAFQIADDILNIVGKMPQLGKEVGTDAALGKATYPAVYGLEESKKQALSLTEKAVRALKPFGKKAEPLQALAYYIVEREV
ncbi:polyprenyl synthetase family protein [candidate division FCPU426 bacterium]|nr:polyprenyl synthetase family protein [candidate division FCPU426 bacterium]